MNITIDLEKLLLKIVSISPEGVDYQDIIKYQRIVLENCFINDFYLNKLFFMMQINKSYIIANRYFF